MFRKIALILSALLVVSTTPLIAAPVVPLTVVKMIPADQDIAGMLVGDSAIYLFGNTPTGGYVTALNKDGSQKWLHSFSDLRAFTISTGALDASGNLWLAGASAAPIAIPAAANPSPTAANPDGVVIGDEGAIRPDLNNLTLWKVSSTGTGAGRYELPLTAPVLPTSLSVDKSGISIVAWQSAGSLFVAADLLGKFGKPLRVGKTTTTLDKVVRNSDGSSILLGSSTELFLGNKAIGARDGIIIKIDTTPKIVQSVRSGEKGATRNWASATSSLLLGGYLKNKTTVQATITKFGTTLKPTWSIRYKATSSAVVANGLGTSFYAAYENGGSGSLITFDKNGKVTATNSFQGQPIAVEYNKTFGLYVYTGENIYSFITK
ncbi:MAG: hypothetical protein NTV90_02680 [Actinobacteria bacterium]|nr:hypothetical protein [Actinomycetota bacterium]